MNIILENIPPADALRAKHIFNTLSTQMGIDKFIAFYPYAEGLKPLGAGGLIRVEDKEGFGQQVGVIQMEHGSFPRNRFVLSTGWERESVTRFAKALMEIAA
jgi:hypothetical protein